MVVTFWRAETAGAGSHEEDQLLSRASDLSPDEHFSLQHDDAPVQLFAAQQPGAQLVTEVGEPASDASEPSEDFMQAAAVQPSSVSAAKEGSDEEADALGSTPAGSSGAVVQEACSDVAPDLNDTLVQDMLYAMEWAACSCLVPCVTQLWGSRFTLFRLYPQPN